MAVHPVEREIGGWDHGIEAIVFVNNADHYGESVCCVNAWKIQAEADGEIARRVEGRECSDFVQIDD